MQQTQNFFWHDVDALSSIKKTITIILIINYFYNYYTKKINKIIFIDINHP